MGEKTSFKCYATLMVMQDSFMGMCHNLFNSVPYCNQPSWFTQEREGEVVPGIWVLNLGIPRKTGIVGYPLFSCIFRLFQIFTNRTTLCGIFWCLIFSFILCYSIGEIPGNTVNGSVTWACLELMMTCGSLLYFCCIKLGWEDSFWTFAPSRPSQVHRESQYRRYSQVHTCSLPALIPNLNWPDYI